jgi:hypothetical protein
VGAVGAEGAVCVRLAATWGPRPRAHLSCLGPGLQPGLFACCLLACWPMACLLAELRLLACWALGCGLRVTSTDQPVAAAWLVGEAEQARVPPTQSWPSMHQAHCTIGQSHLPPHQTPPRRPPPPPKA